jgi:hypothetical protein
MREPRHLKMRANGGLRLVPKQERAAADFSRVGLQRSLFGIRDGTLTAVFTCIPNIEDSTFIDLIKCADESTILDLRRVPRFDIGRLDRTRAFQLFENAQATYIDATSPPTSGAREEDVAQRVTTRICELIDNVRGTLIFLFGKNETSLLSMKDVLAILENTDRKFEVINIPA